MIHNRSEPCANSADTPTSSRHRPAITWSWIALCLVLPQTLPAQATRLTEYQIKAAFLFNFTKFTQWPPDAFADTQVLLTIGILGENLFGDAFDSIAGQYVGDRRVQIAHFRALEDVKNCQVLFIGTSEKKRLPHILRALRRTRILTVGESEDFARQGGMVHFVRQKNKVKFAINVAAAERAGLKLSSKLLKLATIVRDTERREESP